MQKTTIPKKFRSRRQRGAALLLTLVAISIASISAATVATLVASHNTRANIDQNSERALYAADSALNYQAQRLYTNLSNNQVGYDGTNVETATYGFLANPIPVTQKKYSTTLGATSTSTLNNFLGLGASDSAKCWAQYANDPAGTQPVNMSSTNPLYIYGQATVGGVTRTVRVTATGKALFSSWGVFTNGPLSITGSLAATPPTGATTSLVGSNSSISVGTHSSTGVTQATYGSNSSADSCSPCQHNSCPVHLPSCDQLANSCANGHSGCDNNSSNGICQFATCNDNATCGHCCDDVTATKAMPTNGQCPSNGSCQLTLTGKAGGTNIYLPSLNCSNLKIWADVSKGPVNVWVNNTCTNNSSVGNPVCLGGNSTCKDTVDGDCDICPYTKWDSVNNRPATTMSDCSKLHIYYNNPCGSLNVNCNGTHKNICGQIYAYNTCNGTPCGTVHLGSTTVTTGWSWSDWGWHQTTSTTSTGATVNGQIYAQTLTSAGTLTVNSPPVVSATDGAGMMFNASSNWQEVAPIYGN